MYINNIGYMPIYNINVLLGIMKIILLKDQSLGYYTFFREKPSVKASFKTLAFVMTDSLTSENELLCLPADSE